jgi:hypothetical protein
MNEMKKNEWTKQKQKQATSHHNTNSTETNSSFYITSYKFHVQPADFTITSVNSRVEGVADLGRGTIFGTFRLLIQLISQFHYCLWARVVILRVVRATRFLVISRWCGQQTPTKCRLYIWEDFLSLPTLWNNE